MKKLSVYLAILLFVLIQSEKAFGQAQGATIAGNWLGAIEVGGTKYRLALKVSKTVDGTFTAKLDNIDQAVNDLKIDSITQQEKSVRFEAKNLGLSYEGALNDKGDEIAGQMKQGAGAFPLIWKKADAVPTLSRPQDPQKPYPYAEEEVVYENKADKVKLAGTLTVPRGEGKFPAVILITGSGAQDRNETVFGHRPFLVLADYLTRRGIAVLRVDDRGIGGSSAGSPNFTTENFAGDVLAGIEFLKTRKEINPKQIGLVGHSEGGMIAPMAAARSKDVAFIVLLAGLGQTGEDVIYTQNELLQKADGAAPEGIAMTKSLTKKIIAILKTEPDDKRAEKLIREMLRSEKSPVKDQDEIFTTILEQTIAPRIPMFLSAWFRYFVAYNPRPTLEKVKVPVLAINGENDLQVAAKQNLDLIAAGLKAGGNKDYTILSLPNLNHLLQTSKTGKLSEYGQIEETIAPVALEAIGNWIAKQTAKK